MLLAHSLDDVGEVGEVGEFRRRGVTDPPAVLLLTLPITSPSLLEPCGYPVGLGKGRSR